MGLLKALFRKKVAHSSLPNDLDIAPDSKATIQQKTNSSKAISTNPQTDLSNDPLQSQSLEIPPVDVEKHLPLGTVDYEIGESSLFNKEIEIQNDSAEHSNDGNDVIHDRSDHLDNNNNQPSGANTISFVDHAHSPYETDHQTIIPEDSQPIHLQDSSCCFNSNSDHNSDVNHDDAGPVPLASMVYLTEDGENMAETMSVVSDGFTEEELADDLNQLNKALEALELASDQLNEGAAINSPLGKSPSARSASIYGSSFDDGRVDSSTEVSSSMGTAAGGDAFAKNMVKLYNDLAVRLMDTGDYGQAMAMLKKAEGMLENSSVWSVSLEASQDGGILSDKGEGSYKGVAAFTRSEKRNDEEEEEEVTSPNSGGGGGAAAAVQVPEKPITTTTSTTAAATAAIAATNSIDELPYFSHSNSNTISRSISGRARLRAITYNNIGCLYKRTAMPDKALVYLQNALSLEITSGNIDHCASTHLNLCAAYSAMESYQEALQHAERAILLLQRELWGPAAKKFQDGVAYVHRVLATLQSQASLPCNSSHDTPDAVATDDVLSGGPLSARLTLGQRDGAQKKIKQILSSINLLAMAYHNAGVEHERLNRPREAQVSYARASALGTRFLGAKSQTTISLMRAQKSFVDRRYQHSRPSSHHAVAHGGGHHHHHHHHHHGHLASGGGGFGVFNNSRKGPTTSRTVGTSSAATSSTSTKIRQSSAGKRTSVLGSARSKPGNKSTTKSALGRDRR